MNSHDILSILYSPYEGAGLVIMVIALAVHAFVDFATAKRRRDSKDQ